MVYYSFPLIFISIHALRVEGDESAKTAAQTAETFLSTPSGWRATRAAAGLIGCALISIHALRVEGDRRSIAFAGADLWISIHALRVEGDEKLRVAQAITDEFLSTPSGWRATAKTDKVFICFCAKGRRICLFKTRKERICRWRFKKDKFWVLIWCEGSGKSVCALASHCG